MTRIHKFLQDSALVFLLVVPFVGWVILRYIHLDFSYDEFFTFDQFIFVPLRKTLTDYSAPNNHIFSSILHRVYLHLIGVEDLFSLMDTPYKVRMLDFGFSIVTMGYIYRIGQRFFNVLIARLALLFLVTTIPFYNFATLVRGYSLSMMLVSMILYYAWSVEEWGTRRHAATLVLLMPLLLYTIPLNIYFLVSLTSFYAVSTILPYLTRKWHNRDEGHQPFGFFLSPRQNRVSHRQFLLIGLLCMGMLIGICIYLPFYKNFINNRHFKSHGLFYVETLMQLLPQSFRYYLSERYLLVPLALLGFFRYVLPTFRQSDSKILRKVVCCLVILLGPFVMSFIRGDHPPSRAFVNIVPIFALMLALCVAPLQTLFRKPVSHYLILLMLLVYCYGSFAYGIHWIIEPRLKADIGQNTNRYDMYHNFFQAYYQPLKLVRYFLEHYPLDRIPITLVFNLQEYEMRKYLDKYQVRYYQHPYEVLFNAQGQAYIVVAFADTFVEQLMEFIPDVQCKSIYPTVNYHKILLCESAMVKAQ